MSTCRKAYNSYTDCPLATTYEDDQINAYLGNFADRLQYRPEDAARLQDETCKIITAYMNGRIYQAMREGER